ncbi:glutamyl-tRNA reductase [Clostridium botulinum]|uniref:Glutamyl-tRNA reductase n=1 Tax=Clostridium botulinum TaxID=1491 RepID=A0A9Q1ZB74_CLOBO|nr:glutamyl-tRNA reductase [Clostridium botulinum]KEI00916.1 glutamyl-tRNA reductase [Clostridium botulinum C/D str. Sp77]KOA75116.1 glutamyl-tRNA reductase [Clostridium botulinum]KOA82691.1 glutamyl-tRNA reductase [Clostridium botulinum]KOA83249.1 glutamyl-tRNA reductase [Clostridium botulinum]KOA83270.1 glutamyl-tRNA reductase [Clostridium botulinum]
MNLAIVGMKYNNTPIDIREKVSFSTSQKMKCGKYLTEKGIDEVIILSTCNRSEIYIASEDIDNKIDIIIDFYKEYSKVDNIYDYIFIKKNIDAIFHIYNVSSGLDSMILCEDQILGQVKDAMAFSMQHKLSKKILNKLFREAITSAKKIKSELKVSETPISMVYIAIKLLKQNIGSLCGKKACIIGAGEMGRLALKHLIGEDLQEIFVANRTYDNVIDLLKEFPKIKPVKYESKSKILEDVDILITATSAPHIVITHNELKNIKNPLYIMDLALPRDVEKGVEELKNIHLYDVDNFKNISDSNKIKREELSKIAKDIIESKVNEFVNWMESLKVDITIKELNDRCEDIGNEYLGYINRRINLSKRDEEILEKMLLGALKKVIKEPILNLKELNNEKEINKYIDSINNLFNF